MRASYFGIADVVGGTLYFVCQDVCADKFPNGLTIMYFGTKKEVLKCMRDFHAKRGAIKMFLEVTKRKRLHLYA